MRALICDTLQGIDALRVGELPDPTHLPGTVLVDVKAAGVNFADSLTVAGQYQAELELPFPPGCEIAGEVVNGDGTSFASGDRVCGYVGFTGAMAERAILFPNAMTRIPDAMSFEEGASMPVAYGTAYHALVDRADLGSDDTVLVLGAAGGVGLAAVQTGKALGATVIGAVSSDEKERVVSDAGADAVIRYDTQPLREGVKAATGGAGVDVVFDPIGGEATEQALRDTKWNGVLLVIGFASGSIPSIPLNLNLVKGNSIAGVFFGRFLIEEQEKSQKNFEQILEWMESGKLKPHVQKTFPLDEGAEAIRWVAERNAIGRVVVMP